MKLLLSVNLILMLSVLISGVLYIIQVLNLHKITQEINKNKEILLSLTTDITKIRNKNKNNDKNGECDD